MGFRDQDSILLSDYALRFAQRKLDHSRIHVIPASPRNSRLPRAHTFKPHYSSFGLRNDLVFDHNHIIAGQRYFLMPQRRVEFLQKTVPRQNFIFQIDRNEPNFWGVHHDLTVATSFANPAVVFKSLLAKACDLLSPAARARARKFSGVSISRPIPDNDSTIQR